MNKRKTKTEIGKEKGRKTKEDEFSPRGSLDTYIFLAGLLTTLILVYIIRSNFLDFPLERDEGDYGLAGKLILEGATPYLDVFEQKPPGLFYIYALVELIFGTSARALHIGFMFVNMCTIVFLALGLKQIFNSVGGISGALAFAVLSTNPFASGFTVQAEHLLLLFVSASFCTLTNYHSSRKHYLLLISGVLLACTATIKQNGIFFIIALGLGIAALHWLRKDRSLKSALREYTYFAIGGVLTALLVCVAMILQGVWKEFIFWAVTFPREFYVSSINLETGMQLLTRMYNFISAYNPLLWYTSLSGAFLIFFARTSLALKAWILAILALSFFSVWPGLRFYGHYWLQFFFGLAIGFAALAYTVQDYISRFTSGLVSFLVPMLGISTIIIFSLISNNDYYFDPSADAIISEVYGDNPFSESRAIADFINSRNPNPETDKLLVLGSEPQILLETGLKSPTPHTFMVFVASEHPASKAWREEYLEMMKKNEAKYAVFILHPYSWLANSDEAKAFVTECYRHMLTNYTVIGVADIISTNETIYKWNAEAGAYKPRSDKYVLVLERN